MKQPPQSQPAPLCFHNFSPATFLARHWQRQPLLIKGALPGWQDPLLPEELAGLACEEGVEARLVRNRGKQFRMQNGPFAERDFTTLPARNWTLLVQAVDHYLPEVKALLQCVDFLPSWRVDDVMISYAAPGGGVGPHFDYYDVFLVQGQGTRTWRLGQRCDANDELRTASGLKLLQDFQPSAEYVLEPGDVLYVPPGLAHWGVSHDKSLCYSLGFRAPSVTDMLLDYTDQLAETLPPDHRYTDPRLAPVQAQGEIDAKALHQVRDLLNQALNDEHALLRWFGALQTRPRYPELLEPLRKLPPLQNDTQLMTHPGSRIAWHQDTDRLFCFIDGECLELPDNAALRRLLPLLSAHAQAFRVGGILRNKLARGFLEQLICEGRVLVVG